MIIYRMKTTDLITRLYIDSLVYAWTGYRYSQRIEINSISIHIQSQFWLFRILIKHHIIIFQQSINRLYVSPRHVLFDENDLIKQKCHLKDLSI
jgi:hypothetical protein